MLTNFQNWRAWCNANFDWHDEGLRNVEYEPVWGTQYVRKMVKRHEDLGFSDEGIAAVMLGYLFVTTANTIPAALWTILHILLDRPLISRIQSEISVVFALNSILPDLKKLSSLPLINSIYFETLRLRVAGTVGRKISNLGSQDFLGRATNPKLPIMFASWVGGLDKRFWNTGCMLPNGQPQYPVDAFWAERFLEYPNDVMSGPTRRPDQIYAKREYPEKIIKDDQHARLVTKGLEGHWFPFGGGASRCPGETLASHTILATVAMVFRHLEMKLSDPAMAMNMKSKHRSFPFGTHAFDRVVPFRFYYKRRQEDNSPLLNNHFKR